MMKIFGIFTSVLLSFILLPSLLNPTYGAIGEERFRLNTSDTLPSIYFGQAVALSENKIIIGADGSSKNADRSGSAYLYDIATGSELMKLTASDAGILERFGSSVAIDGSIAIIGAPSESKVEHQAGSAYLFDVDTGEELFKLIASDVVEDAHFGQSVSISGNYAIVGAYGDIHAGTDSGSAYIFDVRTGEELLKLTASDADWDNHFGYSVSISGNFAIVGAPCFNCDDNATGSAYLFNITTGEELFKLTVNDDASVDIFGRSVAICDDIAIVGAPHTGNSGAAYLFDVNTGEQLTQLFTDDVIRDGGFGHSVAISKNYAVVGEPVENRYSGSAYLFDLKTKKQVAKLTASNASPNDFFGMHVAISDTTAVVGAPEANEVSYLAGTTYVFNVPDPASCVLLALGSTFVFARRDI